MSLDLYQREAVDGIQSMGVTQTPELGMMDTFFRGSVAENLKAVGMTTMQGYAKGARAVGMAAAPLVQLFEGFDEKGRRSTELQDRYFKWTDEHLQSAVDYWTPTHGDVGMAAEVVGSLIPMLNLFMVPGVGPSAAVAQTQLSTAEDLLRQGVPAGKAQAVGIAQATGLGLGIWMPILGQTLAQRVLVGGAGFNVAQGVATRAASEKILEGEKAAEQYKALDPKMITLDVLLGLAFGGMAHLNPGQRAQGAEMLGKIKDWAQNLSPTQVDAIATLRVAQHLNEDSLPGRPATPQDANIHVERVRKAIDDLINDRPIDVTGIKSMPAEPLDLNPALRGLSDATLKKAAEMGEASALRETMVPQEDWQILKEAGLVEEITAADGSKEAGVPAHAFAAERDALMAAGGAGRTEDQAAGLVRRAEALERSAQNRIEAERPGEAAPLQERAAELRRQAEDIMMRRDPGDPRFDPDPERQAENEANARVLMDVAEQVRIDDDLAAPRGSAADLPQDLTRLPVEEQAGAIGRTVAAKLTAIGMPEAEAQANAAIWQAFFKTTGEANGIAPAELLASYGVDVQRLQDAGSLENVLAQGEKVSDTETTGGQDGQGTARPTRAFGEPEKLFRTVGGRDPAPGWAEATRIRGRDGNPLEVHRGAAIPLAPEHFELGALGRASENPSSGLGVFHTVSRSEAGSYGEVESFYLDIRNPKIIRIEDLPGYDSTEIAYSWREKYRAEGHDGLIITAKHLGGKVNIVSFDPAQNIRATRIDMPPAGRITVDGIERPTTRSDGQPIYPTAEGIQNFWRWFGDSKMVDAEGRPLRLLHGSIADVQEFSTSGVKRNLIVDPESKGFYFTKQGDIASAYARGRDGGNVMPVYLSLKNPLYATAKDGVDHVLISPKKMAEYEAQGYDGIVYNDGEEIVAFRPEQIKSASGNTGEFGGDTGNILYQGTVPRHIETVALAAAKVEQERSNRFDLDEEIKSIAQSGNIDLSSVADNPKYWDAENEEYTSAGFKEVDRLIREKALDNLRFSPLESLDDLNNANQTTQVEAMRAIADALGVNPKVTYSSGGSRYLEVMIGGDSYKFRFADHFNTVRDSTMQPDFNVAPGRNDFIDAVLFLVQKVSLDDAAKPFFQNKARGAISLNAGKTIIALFEKSDASTFPHESAHLFLEITRDMALRPGALEAVLNDWGVLAKEYGIEGGDIPRKAHEAFARGWERFLMEGKAPNETLHRAFQQMRDWLLEVYKSLRGTKIELSDDVRGVMARMLDSQARDPAQRTEAPPVPSGRAEPPPPRVTEGEAPADASVPTWTARPITDPDIQQHLSLMADNAGWAEEGGRIIRDVQTGEVTGRTNWIPIEEWWAGRPGPRPLNATKTRDAVRKALAGEPLKAAERRTVDYMLEVANQRMEAESRIGIEQFDAIAREVEAEGLPPTTEHINYTDLINRALAVNEDAVIRAGETHGHDDAAYASELRRIIDAGTQDAAPAGGRPADQGGAGRAGSDAATEPGLRGGEVRPGQPEPGIGEVGVRTDAGAEAAPVDAVTAEAIRIARDNPDLKVRMGENADGTPIYKSLNDILEDARLDADIARQDANLFRVAAECILGAM